MVCFVLLAFVCFFVGSIPFCLVELLEICLQEIKRGGNTERAFVRNFFRCWTQAVLLWGPSNKACLRSKWMTALPSLHKIQLYIPCWEVEVLKSGIKPPCHGHWWSHKCYIRNGKNKASSTGFKRWLWPRADLVGVEEYGWSLRWQSCILASEQTSRTNMGTHLNE